MWSESRCILKEEATGFSDGLDMNCEREEWDTKTCGQNQLNKGATDMSELALEFQEHYIR